MSLSLEQGRKLVAYARKSIFSDAKIDNFDEKRGVFVTLYTFPDRRLRGCIGFPYPVFALKDAVAKAAKAAAYEDPRFQPLNSDELFTVEISILTEPKPVKNEVAENKIDIGRDGLIIECRGASGLLLPSVFIEHNCTPEEALEMTCEKAGLPLNSWKDRECRILKFQAQVFAETEPGGEVEQKMSGD